MNRTCWTALVLLAWGSGAQASTALAANLADMSLEQLSNIVVSSVSRNDEPLSRAAASIFVITADDIRRSGANSLPGALQLAPNLVVAQVDANQYAISARGFNSTTANKLLVLIDGRTVYTPLYSGTFWDVQDVMLEDVERIEVISGPGATLWGANAVNGVINVITRSSADTQGGLAILGGGNKGQQAGMRYGAQFDGGSYRVYGKTLRRDHSFLPGGAAYRDAGELTQVGFRSDWGKPSEGLTIQGDAYGASADALPQTHEMSGMNLLARWTRDLGEGSNLRVQGYAERTYRSYPGTFKESLDTLDFEMQHRLRRMGSHRLMWGLGLRHYRDSVENSTLVAFMPERRGLDRNSIFVNDEVALRNDLALTLGAKVETNSYTGAEFLPSARLAWQVSDSQLLWAALSRAVRAPSRVDRELFSPSTPPFAVLAGGPQFRSEISRVIELGYRAQPAPNLSYSVTGFYHRHESLRTLTASPAGPELTNESEGHTKGVEAWATWRVREWMRLSAGGTRLQQSLRPKPGVVDLLAPASNGNDPNHWWKLRASFDLSPAHELDVMVRHYASLPNPSTPAYTAVDGRLGWRPARDMELSLVLQNLFDRRHVEWATAANRVELDRGVFVKLRLDL